MIVLPIVVLLIWQVIEFNHYVSLKMAVMRQLKVMLMDKIDLVD